MSTSNITLREFCKKYRNHEFDSPDRTTQIKAGWYDWFCNDKELASRLNNLWDILKTITSDFILDNFCVSFHNHCPMDYALYDEIRFTHKNQKYNFCVNIDSPHNDNSYVIATNRNDWENETAFNDIKSLITWINNWETEATNPDFFERKQQHDNEIKALCEETMSIINSAEQLLNSLDNE